MLDYYSVPNVIQEFYCSNNMICYTANKKLYVIYDDGDKIINRHIKTG